MRHHEDAAELISCIVRQHGDGGAVLRHTRTREDASVPTRGHDAVEMTADHMRMHPRRSVPGDTNERRQHKDAMPQHSLTNERAYARTSDDGTCKAEKPKESKPQMMADTQQLSYNNHPSVPHEDTGEPLVADR
jgi:hypothetical protein